MKFVISTQELTYLINKCFNVVPSKPTVPILGNFLIEAKNNELRITATDLTVGIRCVTEVKVIEEGATTVPAKKFAQLVKELTSINVTIHTNEKEITEITTESSRFKLHGMNKNEFPNLPDMEGAIQINLPQGLLKDMLHRTAFAVSREDNRYVLTGVCLSISNGEATFTGTDGKRMARAYMPLATDRPLSGNYVIPLKAVEELLKVLHEDGEANIYFLQDKIAVEASNTMLITKLLSGDYPDISRIIPEHSDTLVALHREEMMSLLRQISLFTTDTHHPVRFSFSDGELRLSAHAMEVGEGKVSMPINYRGQTLDIAFNPTFFLDILRHTKSETVTIGVTDAFNPGVISDIKSSEPSQQSTGHAKYVLMPMRVIED